MIDNYHYASNPTARPGRARPTPRHGGAAGRRHADHPEARRRLSQRQHPTGLRRRAGAPGRLAGARPATAQYLLGVAYDAGEGVPEDGAEAVRWYRLAAEQGHANAQLTLGVAYATGEGVPEDDAEAVRWYRLAAEKGHAAAQYFLGFAYATGRGVPEDYVAAHMWLNVAAATGDEAARTARENVAARMTREQIAEAQARAREWANRELP